MFGGILTTFRRTGARRRMATTRASTSRRFPSLAVRLAGTGTARTQRGSKARRGTKAGHGVRPVLAGLLGHRRG